MFKICAQMNRSMGRDILSQDNILSYKCSQGHYILTEFMFISICQGLTMNFTTRPFYLYIFSA